MKTQSNKSVGPGHLQRFLDNVIISFVGAFILIAGAFLASFFIIFTVLVSSIAALRFRRQRDKIMQSSDYEYYENELDRGANVIDGKYTVLDS